MLPTGGGGSTATVRNLNVSSGATITLPTDYTDFTWVYIAVSGEDNPTKSYLVPYLSSFSGNSNNLLRLQGRTDMNWNPVARTIVLTMNSVAGAYLVP